ncbi:hypothetical protein A6K76_15225 [Caryophanon latum]|uniref:Uncharacterized protein n=1 Tax=Caryophanon latum TaxID=33977 RepID=A0A1C0YEB5_9BACL|nr:hypothetical protein A6K76_15225 [Caryophanon latum]
MTNLEITKDLFDTLPIDDKLSPSKFINIYWDLYVNRYESSNSMNGTIFENLVIIALGRAGIENIYFQTELTYVPSAIFDVFLYHPEGSYALSIKTTLRERWKQADLEALAIKQVHKDVQCFVVTLSKSEVGARRKRDNLYAGLDGFVLANSEEFDNLVAELITKQFQVAGSVPIVKTSDRRYDAQKFLSNFDLKI